MEQRMQDVLKAHAEQVSVEIRLAIAAQGQEILKTVKEQINAVKKDNTTQMEQAKSTAEKEAKSITRRHYAEENAAHETLETRLLQTMEEFKKTTVAMVLLHVHERLRSFLIQQMAKGRDVKSQGAGQYAIKAVHEQRSCGEANTMNLNTSSMATSTNPSSVSSDEEKEMYTSNIDVSKLDRSNRGTLAEDAHEQLKPVRCSKLTSQLEIKSSHDLQAIRRSEQQNVVALGLAI
ncbi:hypothetical protein PPTG_13927 [Phytophthora nicotianae INRA-310]|uniref:Uncharacterized protein n=1 Tax=Phytophthora nicotianae (strain INRA-310) TaxID=761204 RepID=W2PZR8_PHYN3|nr:hypothetical protein PPTG_13927 [Phytophthora nicotianae INRA-310]ETN06146.1 hypothetical protein PPTG_13927 [Phytophthora nicotianae INRA-310]